MWPVLLMLLVSRSVFCLDQLLLDDLDIGISMGGWQEVPPPMPAAHELILLPSSLQFPRTNLANIASHAVTLYNNHHNKTVYLNSVFALPLQDGQHNDFHVPFVREQAVPPQGNFTFTIVFLPTQIGAVQTEILMRTSFGQLKYQVQGIGVASPFKVVPLTQLVSYAGVNSNAAIIPDITLYNPYDLPIQITEIFSSGGKFYLELPTREFSKEGAAKDEDPDARTQLWTIAAFEKRPVIRVRFVGSLVAGNYSAYIRMKVKCPDDDLLEDIILVIPIRMEVRALQPISLYPEKSIIDLGSVLLHEKRPLSINLFTSDTPDVGVTSLAWDSQVAVGEATTRFRRILDCSDIVVGEELHVRLKIECDLQWTEVIRNISQQWEDFLPGSVMHISGGITVNSTVGPKKSAQIHRIPLFAEVISGTGIELPRNVTVLYPRNDQASIGIFYLRNNFDSPMVVTGIELVAKDRGSDTEAHPVFKVIVQYLQSAAASDFPKVLKPGESWTMAPADLPMESAADGEGPLRSFVAHLQIATNVTDDVIHVPLYGYSGRLSRLVLNAEVRNVIAKVKGVTALEESKMVTDEQASLIDFGSVRLDVEAHRYIALLNDNPMAVELTKWDMPAMDIIISIFHVGCMNKFDLATNKEAMLQPDDWCVFSFAAKTTRAGEFNGTFQYETNYERNELPIRVRGTAGTLTLDSSSKVMSCIPKTICITDIIVESSYSDTVQLHDIVTYKEAGVHIFTKEILPNTANKIGRMYFNPRVSKLEPRGYTNGYPSEIFDNTDTKTLLLLQRTATSIYRMLQERQFVLPFQVNTDKQILSSSAAVDFVWPRLISLRDSLRERVVMVGQELVYNISLLNPSHESIAYWYYFTDDRFHISDLFDTPLPYSTDPIQSLLATRVLSTAGNRGTQKFVLPPGKYHNITIHASGKNEPGVYASMFVLKNNFTFFEGSWQKVKIVQPQFKFGNRKPFSTTPLLFEIQDQPNVCTGGGGGAEMVQGQQQQPSQAVVSTRRVFTAKNTGQLPLNIVGISINSEACSGYGFVVLNCDPFVLAPNETHKVEISFVPDFTVSRIDRKIDFHTDVDFGIQYTLVGVVPQTMLERCRSATGRPWWEAGFKKWALSMLATMALIVVTVAFFESLKILKDHSDATYRQRGPFQAPLDFKKLAAMKTISSSSSGGGGGGQDVATKEMTKAPKKKTLPPSTLFNNKRFSWFINRSQQQQQQPVATAQVLSSLSSSSSSSSSAAGQMGQGGVTTAATASNDKKSSTAKSATKNTERIVSATKSTDSKGAAEVSNKKPTAAGGAKKESATTAKKNKSKGKSTAAPATRPAESSEATVTKVEPKVNNEKKAPEIAEPPPAVAVESVQPKRSVEKSVQGPSTLSLDILTAQQQFVAEQTSYSQSETTSPVGSTLYGKTPGRERKEKQLVTTSKRYPTSGRANKVSLFQQMTDSNHANHLPPMTDPWTNACRGLFGSDPTASDPRSAANHLPYALENRFEERVVPNLNFNELPRDVSGLNAGTSNGPSMPQDDVNGFPENPLGAIGTIPPVSKNYSLFDTENRNPIMQQAGYRNGLLNHAPGPYYNNGNAMMNMGQEYRGNNYPTMTDPAMNHNVAYGYGNNNMDMFESQPRSSHDLYVEYQYQKQELQRLALLLAINQAQTSSEPQPQQAMPQNTHNLSDMNDYMGWDQQSHLLQQQQQQLSDLQSVSRQQFNGRTGGPPPGMGPRRADGGVEPNAEDASNQYDPFRSIWNQWNTD